MRNASVFDCELAAAADFLIIKLESLVTYGAVGCLFEFCLVARLIHPLVRWHLFFQIYLSEFPSISLQNVSYNLRPCKNMVGMYYQSCYYIQHLTAWHSLCSWYVPFICWLDIQNHQAGLFKRGQVWSRGLCEDLLCGSGLNVFANVTIFANVFFTEAQPGKLFLRTNIGVTFEILDGRCAHKWLGCMLQAALGGKKNPTTFQGIESLMLNAVEQEKLTLASGDEHAGRLWEDQGFQQLLQQRRGNQCRHQRMELSKQIRKHIRKRLRERRNLRTERILTEFVQLNRLDEVHHDLVKQHKKCGAEEPPTPHKFAEYLQGIFAVEIPTSNLQPRIRNGGENANVPFFSMGELDYVLCKMRNGRCADTDGLMAEMFKYARVETKRCFLDLLNDVLKTGNLESSWRHSMFVMLPKSGDLSETNTWRPIAILKIAYKIFSSLLNLRLRRQLDYQPSVDQLGLGREQVLTMPSLRWKLLLVKLWNGNAGFGLPAWTYERPLTKLNMEHCLRL